MTTPVGIPAPQTGQPPRAAGRVVPLTPAGRVTKLLRGPGTSLTVAVLAFFLALSASIDFPRAALGFKGDEATYYSLTYSLARDGDMTFKREDLVRVWEEFTAPEGIFLKKGSDLHLEGRAGFPFFRVTRTPDAAADRLY